MLLDMSLCWDRVFRKVVQAISASSATCSGSRSTKAQYGTVNRSGRSSMQMCTGVTQIVKAKSPIPAARRVAVRSRPHAPARGSRRPGGHVPHGGRIHIAQQHELGDIHDKKNATMLQRIAGLCDIFHWRTVSRPVTLSLKSKPYGQVTPMHAVEYLLRS